MRDNVGEGECVLCEMRIRRGAGIVVRGEKYHTRCFRCDTCFIRLDADNYHKIHRTVFCLDHIPKKPIINTSFDTSTESHSYNLHSPLKRVSVPNVDSEAIKKIYEERKRQEIEEQLAKEEQSDGDRRGRGLLKRTKFTRSRSVQAVLHRNYPKDEVCPVCERKVYPMDEVAVNAQRYHKLCFRCRTCRLRLNHKNHRQVGKHFYCVRHSLLAQALKKTKQDNPEHSQKSAHEDGGLAIQPHDSPIDQAPNKPNDPPIDQAPKKPSDSPIDQAPNKPSDSPIDQAPNKPNDSPNHSPSNKTDSCETAPKKVSIDLKKQEKPNPSVPPPVFLPERENILHDRPKCGSSTPISPLAPTSLRRVRISIDQMEAPKSNSRQSLSRQPQSGEYSRRPHSKSFPGFDAELSDGRWSEEPSRSRGSVGSRGSRESNASSNPLTYEDLHIFSDENIFSSDDDGSRPSTLTKTDVKTIKEDVIHDGSDLSEGEAKGMDFDDDHLITKGDSSAKVRRTSKVRNKSISKDRYSLRLKIRGAAKLRAVYKSTKTSDPYCRATPITTSGVKLDTQQTNPVISTIDPKWKYKAKWKHSEKIKKVEIEVWSHSEHRDHTFLGKGKLRLDEKEGRAHVKLEPRNKKEKARGYVSVSWKYDVKE